MMCCTPNVHSLNGKEMHADGSTGARQQQAASAPWPPRGLDAQLPMRHTASAAAVKDGWTCHCLLLVLVLDFRILNVAVIAALAAGLAQAGADFHHSRLQR